MTDYALWLTALSIGLLGSTHCIGMCGGIAGALSIASPQRIHPQTNPNPLTTAKWWTSPLYFSLFYSIGRILSYSAAGFLLGSVGFIISEGIGSIASLFLRIIAGLLLIALGFYLPGWWRGITTIERIGGKLWQRLSPVSKKFIPIDTPLKAITIGLLWGWLPCGLVYSALIWASTAADPARSAILMIFFGLGTLPSVLLSTLFTQKIALWVQKNWVRRASGILLILFGVWTIIGALQHVAHDQNVHQHHANSTNILFFKYDAAASP